MFLNIAFASLLVAIAAPPQGPPADLRLTELRIHAAIVDGVATTELEQTLRNDGARPAEADWILPLPPDATTDRFTMTVGGKEIAGEVLDAAKARRTYEAIVRKRRDPGLLEYLGRGCLRARIFPIPAHDAVVVRVRYREVLAETDGLLAWSFPLRAPQVAGGLRPEHVSADIEVRSRRPIRNAFSPLPGVDTVADGDHRLRATLELSQGQMPERDLSLLIGLADREFGLHLLSYRRPGEPGYFLALLSPKRTRGKSTAQRKTVQFVLDTSGSMEGVKIEQARNALRFFVQSLDAEDTFNVIPFATEAQPFFPAPVAADTAHVQEALAKIARLEARGGTNIEDALATALAAPAPAGRVPMTVFLTDGQPSVGVRDTAELCQRVAQTNRSAQRIFVLGVGDDVNTQLLDLVAEETRGHRDYIAEHEDIELVTGALLTRISQPVLADLELHARGGLAMRDVVPQRLPDLFAGSRLLVLGRYDESGKGQIELCGQIAGKPVDLVYDAAFAQHDTRHDFIPALWAQRRVGTLLDAIRLHGPDDELLDEVTRLGKEFGIVTPYTAHLIVEETARVAGQPVPPPARGADYVGPGDVAPPGPRGPSTPGSSVGAARSAERLRRLGKEKSGASAVQDSQRLSNVTGSDEFFMGGGRNRVHAGPAAGPAAPRPAPASQARSRRAAGRTFYLADDIWIDRAYQVVMQNRIEKIEAFSPTYFAVLAENPELAQCFALGTRVRVVVGKRVLETTPPS